MADNDVQAPAKGGEVASRSTSHRTWEHPLLALREETNRLFEDFFAGMPFGRGGRRTPAVDPWRGFEGMFGASFPAVDVSETESAYRISAELPGLEEKDVELSLAGGLLTLKGEKQQSREEEAEGAYLSERRFGSFSRSFRVPEDVDPERIEAKFKNGVLTVTLPRQPSAQERRKRIEVTPG